MKPTNLHTYEDLAQVLEYRPEENGSSLVWKRDMSTRAKAGQRAGCACKNTGYWVVALNKKRYYAHRLVWILTNGCWPELELDHIDSNKNNNQIENLRECTHSQNCHARKARNVGISGYRGVSWCSKNNKWRAVIGINGKKKRLGLFDDPKLAHVAYTNAKAQQAYTI